MSYRLWPARLLALTVTGCLGALSVLPQASSEELGRLSARFGFTRLALPAIQAPPAISSRPTNPQIAHIARWMSSLGTSAAVGDIDDDGRSNDLCRVEPRTGEILVSPLPGTGERFATFTLDTQPALDPLYDVATGCKIGDFNEDGLADLLVPFVGRTPLIWLRRPDTAPGPGAYAVQGVVAEDEPWWTSTVLQVDLDGDGHLDLVVGNYFPDGQQFFGPEASGPVNMHDTFSRARNGGRNRVLLWAGATAGPEPTVTWREVPNPFPGEDAWAWTLALGAADLDKDGLSELYVANDFGPDTLYHNRSTPGSVVLAPVYGQPGFFIPSSLVLGRDSFKGMGVDFGDVNNDGLFDLFVSNITVHGGLEESHFLFLSEAERHAEALAQGVAPYADHGEKFGVSRSSWCWDTRLVDLDNDGNLELMQATGFLKGSDNWWADLAEFANTNDQNVANPANWPEFPEHADVSGRDPEPFYVMGEDGRYVDLSAQVGFDGQYNARGLALGDADADGDLDIVLANQWEDSWYFRNEAPSPGAFLGLQVRLSPAVAQTTVVEGITPALDAWPAIGAFAELRLPDGRVLIRQVDGGNGHAGASAAELHFGLGELPASTPLEVLLRWRDHTGRLRTETLTLRPGWHTVTLNPRG